MIEYTVRSIDDLMIVIRILLNKRNERLWFRGQQDASWELIPSVQRNDLSSRESYITNDFYIRSKQILPNPPKKDEYSAWLSLMQHYWLPTRLLDWSMSPLIALYFAVEHQDPEISETDACIWCLYPRSLNEQFGFGNLILPSDAYTVQCMLVRAFKDNEIIDAQFEDRIVACCSVQNDLRMYSQQSAFTVHNTKHRLIDLCDEQLIIKIIIPSSCRNEFLQNLDIFGINQAFIYPDMEHIARDIRNREKRV